MTTHPRPTCAREARDNIRALRTQIATFGPEHFNMGFWIMNLAPATNDETVRWFLEDIETAPPINACGMAACLGGHIMTATRADGYILDLGRRHDSMQVKEDILAQWLGLADRNDVTGVVDDEDRMYVEGSTMFGSHRWTPNAYDSTGELTNESSVAEQSEIQWMSALRWLSNLLAANELPIGA